MGRQQTSHSEQQLTKIRGIVTARLGRVVAKAVEVHLRGGTEFELVIAAAGTPSRFPTSHDRDHACVASYVFSQKPYFQRYQCSTSVLRYENGQLRRISVSVTRGCALVARVSEDTPENRRQPDSDLPAPLVGFMVSQQLRSR